MYGFRCFASQNFGKGICPIVCCRKGNDDGSNDDNGVGGGDGNGDGSYDDGGGDK